MSIKIYCDTNIYLDFLLDRKNFYGDNLGDEAFSVFNRVISCEFILVVSSWNLVELKNKIEYNSLNMLFSFLKKKVVTVEHTKEDIEKAKEMSEHFQDALHVLLAVKAGAKFLVTRNIKDFLPFRNLIEIKLPEYL